MAQLINPITADGDYEFTIPASVGSISISGNFGGGTITGAWSLNNIDYIVDPDINFTSDVIFNYLTAAIYVRLTLTGATNPSLKVLARSAQ